jgi:hypothetical protein
VEQPFEYGNLFSREIVGGVERLRIALDNEHDRCLRALTSQLIGPFQLLYVLHTTRTGAALGRYQSPELNVEAVRMFVDSFARFLSEDARHDFWIRSHGDDATIIFDRHNLILRLRSLGCLRITVAAPWRPAWCVAVDSGSARALLPSRTGRGRARCAASVRLGRQTASRVRRSVRREVELGRRIPCSAFCLQRPKMWVPRSAGCVIIGNCLQLAYPQ